MDVNIATPTSVADEASDVLVLDAAMRAPDAHDGASSDKDAVSGSLIGQDARDAMARSFSSLHTALEAKPQPSHTVAAKTPVANGSSLTLEDLVRQEVRGLVREWLEANLPPMVETMVRAEINRMASRR